MTTFAPILAVFGFGGGEILAILAIILLLFGGSKLPSLARGLGQSMKEFKKASREDDPPAPADPKAAGEKKAEPPDKSGVN